VFYAEQQKIEVVVFPKNKQGLKPLSPVDGKPMQRADIADVEMLLNETSSAIE
jgi:hypothetical protein